MRVQVNIVARKISGSCFARDERTVNILLPSAPTFLECMLRSCAPQTNGLHSDQCPSIACAAIGDACALGNSQTSVCVHHVVCHACDVVRLSGACVWLSSAVLHPPWLHELCSGMRMKIKC